MARGWGNITKGFEMPNSQRRRLGDSAKQRRFCGETAPGAESELSQETRDETRRDLPIYGIIYHVATAFVPCCSSKPKRTQCFDAINALVVSISSLDL